MKLIYALTLLAIVLEAQSDPAWDAYQAWRRDHPVSDSKARTESLVQVSADWVAKWPDSQLAWRQRREALVMTHSHSAELWKQADRNLIRLSPPHTVAGMAAYHWVTAGVNLADAGALVTSEIAWRDAQPRRALPDAPALSDMVAQANSSSSFFAL